MTPAIPPAVAAVTISRGSPMLLVPMYFFCPAALFFVKGKLKCGEGQVAPKRSFVAVEEGAVAFCSGDCARSVNGGAVVVAGVEVRVVMPALQLKAGFEDF